MHSVDKCIQYFARQGLAFRGHEQGEGNLDQLIRFSAGMNENIQARLSQNQDNTYRVIQNEMLVCVASYVVRAVCQDIQKQDPAICYVIVDGKRDITGTEQESVCIRYIAGKTLPVEVFVGFYAVDDAKGKTLAMTIIEDVLLRLELPISLIRGQTYDGAANTAATYNGAHALIRQDQPLAFQPADLHQYFSVEYDKLIDTVLSRLKEAIKQEGAVAYGSLESCLLTGCINEKGKEYPEFDINLLRIQLEMFHRQSAYSTVDEAANVMRCHFPEFENCSTTWKLC